MKQLCDVMVLQRFKSFVYAVSVMIVLTTGLSCGIFTHSEEHHKGPRRKALICWLRGFAECSRSPNRDINFYEFCNYPPIKDDVLLENFYLMVLYKNPDKPDDFFIVSIPTNLGLLYPECFVMNGRGEIYKFAEEELIQRGKRLNFEYLQNLNYTRDRLVLDFSDR